MVQRINVPILQCKVSLSERLNFKTHVHCSELLLRFHDGIMHHHLSPPETKPEFYLVAKSQETGLMAGLTIVL